MNNVLVDLEIGETIYVLDSTDVVNYNIPKFDQYTVKDIVEDRVKVSESKYIDLGNENLEVYTDFGRALKDYEKVLRKVAIEFNIERDGRKCRKETCGN